ncbi:hypothetical protein B0H12DRAFT_648995 [Mycena haematopus]|nr:hypothetical protein B0H12DRAFT_648995 [Mycena haematopus]
MDSKEEYLSVRHLGSPPIETTLGLLRQDVDIQGSHRLYSSKFNFPDSTEDVLYFRYGFKPLASVAPSSVGLTLTAVRRLLGDPEWNPTSLQSDTDHDIYHNDVSLFLGYFCKAQKLEDIPPELYELRQQGSAVLRPSPIQLRWEIIDGTTYYFLSPKVYTLGRMTGPVVVRSAAVAIEVLRRDWTTMEQVALNLTARGIPFNTFLRGSAQSSPPLQDPAPSYRGFGIRPKGFQATLSDYRLYELARNRIFRSHRGRRALMMGGIVARLARGIADVQSVCYGPTKSLHRDIDGHRIWDSLPNSPAYWEDSFTQQEDDLICGLYEVETGIADKLRHDGRQKKFVSWWPPASVWKSCRLEMGYWTPLCEEWFLSRLAEILNGNAQLHSRIEWRQILGVDQPQTNDRLAAEFLAENGTRIAAGAFSQQFPKAIRSEDSLHLPSGRFYFTLRTQRPDSPMSQTADEKSESLPSAFPKLSVDSKETLKQPEIQHLTRQYWDMRRKITALALRGEAMERGLRNLHVKDPNIYLTSAELSRRLAMAQRELTEERNRSRKVEHVLEDIRRECKTPTVIPLLSSASSFLEG